MKMFDIFLIFAQNIECKYTSEPPRRGGSNEYPHCMFESKNKYQSRTNGPINAHLTIAQVMPRYNHNNEKQEALL